MNLKSILKAGSGTVFSALIFLLTTPIIIDNFGIERFGFITLLMVGFSAASLLDLGIGRAVTYYVSSAKVSNEYRGVIWFVLLVSLVWGGVLFVPISLSIQAYAGSIVYDSISKELTNIIWLIGLTVPLVVGNGVLRGVFEGVGRFGLNSSLKILLTLMISLSLAFNTNGSATLNYVGYVFFVSRALVFVISLLITFKLLRCRIKFNIREALFILKFSLSSSVSSLSSTTLNIMDRFVAGAFLVPALFGAYSLVSEALMRGLLISGSVSSVLYPFVSRKADNRKSIREVAFRYYKIMLIVLLPGCIFVSAFGDSLIQYWIGSIPENLDLSRIIIYFAIGLFFLSFSQISYSIIQGMGAVYVTAKLHLLQLTIFLPLIIVAADIHGLHGILSVWLARVTVDFLASSMLVIKKLFY